MKKELLFNKVKNQGEGAYEKCHIYAIEVDDSDVAFRVDCSKLGSFEIVRYTSHEKFDIKTDEWEWIDEETYSFRSLDELYEGFPVFEIDTALELLDNKL